MKERSYVIIFLILVLFIQGCGGGDKEISDSITFISESELHLKESEIETFKFTIQAESESNSRLEFQLKGDGDGKFLKVTIDGILSFKAYYYNRGEKKSIYEIDVVASVVEGTVVNNNTTVLHKQSAKVSEKQHIIISIEENPIPTSVVVTPISTVVVTSPPTSTPTPVLVTPTPIPVKTPTPIPTPTPIGTPIPVVNQAPLANAGADTSTTVNQAITLRGSGSDSDGRVIRYEWKNGSRVLATTASFEYLPTVVGTDILTFTVTDDDGATDSDTVLVTVVKEVVVSSTSKKWITPTKSVCESNGGRYGEDENINYCEANWENSKVVCRISGGELPTIEVLREVISDCGGVPNDYDNNAKNSSYQACYKEKGFTSESYWSSTTHVSGSSDAWGVGFGVGGDGWRTKTEEGYLRCIGEGE